MFHVSFCSSVFFSVAYTLYLYSYTLYLYSYSQQNSMYSGLYSCSLDYVREFLCGIARAEHDGTRAETRFRLSSKWTSPFKSAGDVSSFDCWQPRCAHQLE